MLATEDLVSETTVDLAQLSPGQNVILPEAGSECVRPNARLNCLETEVEVACFSQHNIRRLHERARCSGLDPDELATYSAAMERFLSDVVAKQNAHLTNGQVPRQVPRIARSLQLQIASSREVVRTVTLDLCIGGFSALLPAAMSLTDPLSVTICLRRGELVTSPVRVVSVRGRGRCARVSFAFDRLAEAELERLKVLMADELVSRFGKFR